MEFHYKNDNFQLDQESKGVYFIFVSMGFVLVSVGRGQNTRLKLFYDQNFIIDNKLIYHHWNYVKISKIENPIVAIVI